MKSKISFIILIIAVVAMTACSTTPKKEVLLDYLESLKPYYPYVAGEELVFENEELGQTWEITAYDDNNSYPNTYVDYDNTIGSSNQGCWFVNIDAPFAKKGKNPEAEENISFVHTYIDGNGKKQCSGRLLCPHRQKQRPHRFLCGWKNRLAQGKIKVKFRLLTIFFNCPYLQIVLQRR
jgi:hypothetical protein